MKKVLKSLFLVSLMLVFATVSVAADQKAAKKNKVKPTAAAKAKAKQRSMAKDSLKIKLAPGGGLAVSFVPIAK